MEEVRTTKLDKGSVLDRSFPPTLFVLRLPGIFPCFVLTRGILGGLVLIRDILARFVVGCRFGLQLGHVDFTQMNCEARWWRISGGRFGVIVEVNAPRSFPLLGCVVNHILVYISLLGQA
jgi:hypothetical protein